MIFLQQEAKYLFSIHRRTVGFKLLRRLDLNSRTGIDTSLAYRWICTNYNYKLTNVFKNLLFFRIFVGLFFFTLYTHTYTYAYMRVRMLIRVYFRVMLLQKKCSDMYSLFCTLAPLLKSTRGQLFTVGLVNGSRG